MKKPSIFKAIAAVLVAALIVPALGLYKSDGYFRDRAFKLRSEHGSCSGEQVRAPSGKDYILTAAHCRILEDADGSIEAVDEQGRSSMHRVIAEDPASDLLLLEGAPNLKGLSVAGDIYKNESVRTFTHGRGWDTYQTAGELIQEAQVQIFLHVVTDESPCPLQPKYVQREVEGLFMSIQACMLDVTEVVTTAKIVPGSSGGMVVDSDGALVGVVSAGDGDFGMLVGPDDIQRFLAAY